MNSSASPPQAVPSAAEPESPLAVPRAPALVYAVVLATGMVIDRWNTLPTRIWFTLACGAWLGAMFVSAFRPRFHVNVGLTLIALFALGAGRHHQAWSDRPEHDLSRFARNEPAPVKLRARLVSSPEIREVDRGAFRPEWQESELTSVRIATFRLNDDYAVTGHALLYVAGRWESGRAGDEIEILGHLVRPATAHNPGEFDYADWLRRQGIEAIVRADDVRQVTVREAAGWSPRWFLPRLRATLRGILSDALPRENADVAAALLLGSRSALDDELREAFVRTGTMHLLAISGLHVGLFAWMISTACRLAGCSWTTQNWTTIALLIGYAGITELRSSVFRATVFLVLFGLARLRYRVVNPFQILGLTACLLLLFDPPSLFDTGAQLSFLAVSGIFHVQPWLRRVDAYRTLFEQASEGLPMALPHRAVYALRRWFLKGLLIALSVWVMTLPVSINSFHLIAPWGIILTMLLIPLVAVALAAGALLLVCGSISSAIAAVPAAVVAGSLSTMGWTVRTVAGWSSGWWSIPELTAWWVLGYYLLLLPWLMRLPKRSGWLRSLFPAWCAFGVALIFSPRNEGELRVTVLSVGHGLSVVIETPEDRIIVYDIGSLDGGRRAFRAVRGFFEHRGRRYIDLVVLSHSDTDHYSGLPDAMRHFDVRDIGLTRHFAASGERPALEMLAFIERSGIPVTHHRRGELLWNEPAFSARVLHPDSTRDYSNENAASLVVLLQYRGRRILLTGDLEREGLASLLERDSLDVDVLLAPHHGSPAANPRELADWAKPEHVIASSGRRLETRDLDEVYGSGCRIYQTRRDGAIRITVGQKGELEVRSHAAQTADF